MNRLLKILIALDQFCGALLFKGIHPDETISAYCWRKGFRYSLQERQRAIQAA